MPHTPTANITEDRNNMMPHTPEREQHHRPATTEDRNNMMPHTP